MTIPSLRYLVLAALVIAVARFDEKILQYVLVAAIAIVGHRWCTAAPNKTSPQIDVPVAPLSLPCEARPTSQFSINGSSPIPHGTLKDFYDGIDKRIGIVSLGVFEQMRKEHCEFSGCNFEFKSNNYNISTCPEK